MSSLTNALNQLRKQRELAARTLTQLDAAISALDASGDGNSRRGGSRKMSAAARKRIAAAQRARWAKWRKART